MKGLLVAAGAGFPRTHGLAELAGRAIPLYPALTPSLESIGPLTVWSVAYRYPGIEEDDEPEPDGAALLAALAAIGILTSHLQTLAQA